MLVLLESNKNVGLSHLFSEISVAKVGILTDYCSSKFAVVGFTESLRVELKCINPDNSIVVSTVCPFHVKTKLFNGIEFNHLKWLGLSMDPEYVAKKIVDGILANKKLILVPSFTTSIFLALRK